MKARGLLMAAGVFQPWPPRLCRSIGWPSSQSTAWMALYPPMATLHRPEIPTTWPASLIAVAAESGSPGYGGSCRTCHWPSFTSQMTASNCRTCTRPRRLTQVGSWIGFSAQPTIWPRLLTPAPIELLPPRPGSCVILPFFQANATQELPLPKPNTGQEKVSFRGSCDPFSVTPEISPELFLTGHRTLLLGPPSVPRGTCCPGSQSVAS